MFFNGGRRDTLCLFIVRYEADEKIKRKKTPKSVGMQIYCIMVVAALLVISDFDKKIKKEKNPKPVVMQVCWNRGGYNTFRSFWSVENP